jgi:hypothetical protein
MFLDASVDQEGMLVSCWVEIVRERRRRGTFTQGTSSGLESGSARTTQSQRRMWYNTMKCLPKRLRLRVTTCRGGEDERSASSSLSSSLSPSTG